MTTAIATVSLPDGERIPTLGQGTWEMGEQPARRVAEIAALRAGVELGMTLIDTAEMYGDGATESLLGEALAGLRERVFLVSKVYPHNASRRGVQAACEQSLKRWKRRSQASRPCGGRAKSATGASATSTPTIWRS
jgi:diketogulonate reductase-like aldo/keto reductase